MQVTFQDRLKFNAFCSHVTNPTRHVTNLPRQEKVFRMVIDKLWTAVDFAPRYHQVRLNSAKLDFSRHRSIHNRAESAKREALYRTTLEKMKRERERGRQVSTNARVAELNSFLTRFRPLGPRDEDAQRARTWRDYQTYPYNNLRPFDHRGLDAYPPCTRLNTVKTPDPFYILLKNKSLSDSFRERYTDQSLPYGTRDVNFKFRTLKTPELPYDYKLLLKKGRYSPAFTAHEAYLSRVYKNISSSYSDL